MLVSSQGETGSPAAAHRADREGVAMDGPSGSMARYGARNISRAAFLRLENSLMTQKLTAELDSGSLLPSA